MLTLKSIAATAAGSAALACLPLQAEGDRTIMFPAPVGHPDKVAIPGAHEFELTEIDAPKGIFDQVTVDIPIKGVVHEVILYRFSMRSDDFELLVDDGTQLNVTNPSEHRTYRGTVAGIPESSARISILDDGIHGSIDLGEEDGKWFVQPARSLTDDEIRLPEDLSEKTHLISKAMGGFLPGYTCGNDIWDMDLADHDDGEEGEEDGPSGGVAGATIYYVEIAFDTDYEFFQKNSNSVSNTINDIELIYNLVENIYEDDVAINFEISAILVRSSSSDPYSSTTADGILCEFRNLWNTGDEDDIRRDVAQIFTGKNVSGNVLGLAWLGVVCNLNGTDCSSYNSLAYGMCESRYTTQLTYRTSLHAHELGHNFGAGHCDSSSECRIMCSGNGGCDYPNGFAPVTISTIISFRNSMSCDTILGDELTLPFLDEFDSISSSRWVFNKGGTASTSALNEPSPSRSLNLDSTGSGAYADDEIRSRTILASGYDPMWISFHTQHRGVESGKSLIVEYFNSSGDWAQLTEIVSDGTDQDEFVFHEFEMGSDAMSNRLRIRIRTDGSSSTDDWYIDDFEIDDSAAEPPVDPPANDECSGSILLSDGITPFSNLGATDTEYPLLASCDEGNGTNMGSDVWFYYITSCAGTISVGTCGSTELDTKIAVYNGLFGCPYQDEHLMACSDDSTICGDDGFVTVSSSITPAIYIRVGTEDGSTAENLQLLISCLPDEEPCDGDLSGDGLVDGTDLAIVLGAWGTIDGDVNGDGITDGADLSIVLGGWGECP